MKKRSQRFAVRAVSIMLAMCLLIGLIPITQISAMAAVPTVISAQLKSHFVEKGNTAKITVTGGGVEITGATLSYSSADTSVATVDSEGIVTGVEIGKTTIMISADYGSGVVKTTSVEIPVVGENLLTRNGVKHGEFENGVYLNGRPGGAAQADTFWWNAGYGANTYVDQVFTLVTDRVSHLTGEPTKIVKFTFPELTQEQINDTTLTRRDIRLKAFDFLYTGDPGTHQGQIVMDKDKLYEYTGWVKAENTRTLATDFSAELYFLQTWNVPPVKYYYLPNNVYKVRPWTDTDSGNQDWTFFNMSPFTLNSICEQLGYTVLGGEIRLTSTMKGKSGDLLVSNLSFHEVTYDKTVFTASKPLNDLKIGDTISTSINFYSNTGKKILSPYRIDVMSSYSIISHYASSNAEIASINDNGVITINGYGTATISASTTIGGVTQQTNLTVNAPPPVLDSVTLNYSKETIKINETVNPVISGTMSDGSAANITQAAISYSVDNPVIASVDAESGIVTGLGVGNATIQAVVRMGDKEITAVKEISVIDVSEPPLSGKKVVYNFVFRKSTWQPIQSTDVNDIRGITFSFTDGNWEWHSNASSFTPVSTSFYQYINDLLRITLAATGQWVAFKIKVDTPGRYRVNMHYFRYKLGGAADIYIIPASAQNIDENLIPNYKLGSINFGDAAAVSSVEDNAQFNDWSFDSAGEYLLAFKQTSVTPGRMLLLKSFNLNGLCQLESVSVSADKTSICVGDRARVSVASGILTDGSPANLTAASISYTSSDDNVATVSDTGIVSALKEGSAEITANVSIDGITKSASVTITVASGGGTEQPPSGVKAEYNFIKKSSLWINPDTLNVNDIRGITYDFTGGNWEYHSIDPDITPVYSTIYLYPDKYLRINLSRVGNWFAFKIKVPEAGRYSASLNYKEYNKAGESEVYLIPATITNVEGCLNDDYNLLGNVNYYRAGSTSDISDATATLNDIYIPQAGEYLLVFKQSSIANGKFMLLNKFILNGAGLLGDMKINTGNTAMFVGETRQAELNINNESIPADSSDLQVIYSSENPDVATINEDGLITAHAIGVAQICASVTYGQYSRECSDSIMVGSVKSRRSFYTDEKVANARENIVKYSWAEAMNTSTIEEADKYVGHAEELWDMVTTQELPRSDTVGLINDPEAYICPYCKTDLRAKYSLKPWITDAFNDPWKIKCPECNRRFPSNDFGSFYKLGIDEHGNWNYKQALDANKALVDSGQPGYLVNTLYPEMDEHLDDEGNIVNAGVHNWGVDDGYGFVTGKTFDVGGKTVIENKTFIAYYNTHALWLGELNNAQSSLRMAYLYTGDAKYGRTGAILTDRIADVYPDFDLDPYPQYYASHGMSFRGKILGKIRDYGAADSFARSYDTFWPAMEDPQVVDYLSQKASQYKFKNPKTSAQLIRTNCENGILREIYKAVRDYRINGNFGMHQQTLATAAVILDTNPETKEWIDFCFKSGGKVSNYEYSGGNVSAQLVDIIDRDGHGAESSPEYNVGWLSNTMQFADEIEGYDKYPSADLYNNPKFIRMQTALMELTMCSRFTPTIGDSGVFGSADLVDKLSGLIKTYTKLGDPNIARLAYIINGQKTTGMHADIFTKNPEEIVSKINEVIKEDAALRLGSHLLSGYGFAALRDGYWIKDADDAKTVDTQRGFWMCFGNSSLSHSHKDKLNLDVYAYGLDLAPDLGYPESSGNNANRNEWMNQTLSHNTVLVNEATQKNILNANPMHFDDGGKVKVMDVDVPGAYDAASIYRRTVVMIEANDGISYGIDFFRVKGGNDHLYSFHALSNEATVENVTLINQEGGTSAGVDVPWGPAEANATYPTGYNWLRDIQKSENPGTGTFSVDWKITDFHKVLPITRNLHLRLTMLNDFNLGEVTIASGTPPQLSGNPEKVKYLIARRSGNELDSLFTSVIEPYDNDRYLSNMISVPTTVLAGTPVADDMVKAIKVTHTSGRVDYIVYATNNQVTYRIDDAFDFKGFIGVYSMKDDKKIYTYLNDGEIIGNVKEITPAATGEVLDFSKNLSTDNYITVSMNENIDPATLAGKYIYVDNNMVQNGCYEIKDVTFVNGGVRLGLGNTTLICSYINDDNFDAGYIYNIAEGQNYRIPLNSIDDAAPVFEPLKHYTVDASSELRFSVKATSPLSLPLTYSAVILPQGAWFDPASQEFVWVPDSKQLGTNIVAFKVSDGQRETVAYGNIDVLRTAPAAPVVYVATDGTGDFNCDGGDNDQIEIQAAIDFVLANEGFTTIHLKAGTYTVNDTIYIAGKAEQKVILEGEEGAVVILSPDACWPVNKALIENKTAAMIADTNLVLGNFIIRGFKMDGNGPNVKQAIQSGTTVRAMEYPATNGINYYNLIYLQNCKDIEVSHMYLTHNFNDGLQTKSCTNVEFHDNYIDEIGHDGLYANKCEYVNAYNNTIFIQTNSGLRASNTNHVKFYNNVISARGKGGPGIEIQKENKTNNQAGYSYMTDIEVFNNTIYDIKYAGIWIFGYATAEAYQFAPEDTFVNVHHNIIYNCGYYDNAGDASTNLGLKGGIVTDGFNAQIENNVIDGCHGAAINVHQWDPTRGSAPGPYTLTIRNNIISNTEDNPLIRSTPEEESGYGIYYELCLMHSFNVDYNCFYNNNAADYKGFTPASDAGNLFGQDPCFADAANHDYHLKSQYGRWNGETFVNDDVTSPCIDAGDPGYDYSNELMENGGRVNIGRYGNTSEASRSISGVAAPVASLAPGKYDKPQKTTLASATEGSVIRYTTDGSEPTMNSKIYKNPIPVTPLKTVIKAFAHKEGMLPSETVTFEYVVDPGNILKKTRDLLIK